MDEMRAKGLTPSQIAEGLTEYANINKPEGARDVKISTTQLRAAVASSTEQIRGENTNTAIKLLKTGMSTSAIGREMGVNESTVRGWLKTAESAKEGSLKATADVLKAEVEKKQFLDVGKGEHLYLGISFTKFNTAVAMLQDEGYEVHSIKVPQLGTGKMTNYKVLAKPGVTWNETRLAVNRGELRVITAQSDDGGLTFRTPKDQPVSVNSKRIDVRYAEDGGTKMDGVIELRRGVEDLSLDAKRYAQVRVAVDGTHYLKGMAMYADDLPDGVDMRFNTNKSKTDSKVLAEGKLGTMKPMKTDADGNVDPDNPFGATTRPKMYVDKKGKEQTSPLNIVNEEGRWDQWANNLSSQMLSKQPLTLASAQLGKVKTAKQEELDEIMALTNPVVKRKLLQEFADSADAAAVHLKAAHLPRQSTHVILPMNSMRPNEIYAPNFDNGERVVLVRHPHGGPFEIPELVVNNKNRTAQRILENAKDAVGIHHSVAEQLSGADFDGDTVLVIPNDHRKVKTRPPLEGLKGFDPKTDYKIPDDDTTTPRMTKQNTQTEMGKISNLITDMTIHKANDDEITRAVKHSMVVIDAEKHGLNYKQSERDHGIANLKKTYQKASKSGSGGASTLISKASSEDRVPQRKQLSGAKGIDPKTGEKVFVPTGRTRKIPIDPNTGKPLKRPPGGFKPSDYEHFKEEPLTTKGTKMEFVKDAFDLSSGQPMENVYAAHANAMKALANQARKADVELKMPKQSSAAKAVYAKEVASLDAKLAISQRNAPIERRAQVIGNAMAKARIEANPGLDKDDIKKINYQSLEEARLITGAGKKRIGSEEMPLTDREWEAIQSGAISSSKLGEILSNADMKRVRELATPKPRTSLTPGQMARARQMEAQGRPMSEIADSLGLPRSTIIDNLGRQ